MEEIGTKDINKVIDAIHDSCGINFKDYAFSSFKRRILRFMQINNIRDINGFIEIIKSDKSFTTNLVKEITVNVTEMFRDPSFWIIIRDMVLPQISYKSQINIWHAARSTGEEVYSMAILLKESNLLNKSQIIATDLNSSVLRIAEIGSYTLKSQETNIKNYAQFGGRGKLTDYYTVKDNHVIYNKQLIDNVRFMSHNLVQDGPVSVFDLILCRNVLIYFNFELQDKVVQTFKESMAPGSFLGIGSKESIRWCKASGNFREECPEENIYRKIGDENPKESVLMKKYRAPFFLNLW